LIVEEIASKTAVVVVNYRAGEALLECLQSVRKTEPEVEIILVDNDSTDGSTAKVMERLPGVRLVENKSNGGYGNGANKGVAETTREYIVFLNQDTEVLAGWLQAMITPLCEDPSVGLVTPKVLLRADPEMINVAGLDVHLSGISMCRGAGAVRSAFSQIEEVGSISGAAFAIRRKVFEKLGGFDLAYFLYMEDVDLSLRSRLLGYKNLYIPRGVVLHDYELTLDPQKVFLIERGRYWMLLKCFRWRTLFAMLPVLMIAEAVAWGWVLLKKPRAFTKKLQAYWWVILNWREIRSRRDQLQARRSISDTQLIRHLSWSLDFRQVVGPHLARISAMVFDPFLKAASWFTRVVLNVLE
jgi:GT2 family glycosyltransferase